MEPRADTANCCPNNNQKIDNSASSIELITGIAPNREDKSLLPFSCPITFVKPKEK